MYVLFFCGYTSKINTCLYFCYYFEMLITQNMGCDMDDMTFYPWISNCLPLHSDEKVIIIRQYKKGYINKAFCKPNKKNVKSVVRVSHRILWEMFAM